METVVSGIRPTGNLHLGNYFGAVKGFLQMQNEYNCFFFIDILFFSKKMLLLRIRKSLDNVVSGNDTPLSDLA